MRTTFSSKVPFSLVFSMIALGFLVACGPSQAELDATATKFAGEIFATQTAQAPTATVTPTAREVAEEHYLKGEDFRLEEQWELAIEAFTQAISVDPEYAEAFLNRGLAYYGKHENESAIADFEQAIDLGLDPQTPEIFTNRGRAFSIMEDYDSAIADFDEATRIDPEFVEAYVRRGFVYAYDRDDFETGLADFEQAIALDSKYSLAYSRRADVYVRRGEYELAIEDLSRAIELDKQDPYAYAHLGEALYNMGDLDQAIVNLDRAIELDPENYWGYYYRGIVNADQGNYDQAIAEFDRSIELEPQDGWAYYERGYVYYFIGDLDKALDDLNLAIELEPQIGSAYYFRGRVYYDLGDYERAIADYDEAIELKPQSADFFYSRGLIHAEYSDPEIAISDLETALEFGLTPEAEQHAREVLEVLNAVNSSGLTLDWLVTADDLESFSDEIGIVQWESVAEFEMVNRVCRAFNGLSWSANPNIATNCIFTVTPGSTFTDVIEWLNEMEMLSPEAAILEPTVDYPGEYALYVGSTDYGHADFYAILFTNDLVYWSSVSLGVPLGYSAEGVYIDSGEIIDTFLYNIFETNFERSASANEKPSQFNLVLFEDDFSDPSSGWDQINSEEGVTDYIDGAYRIYVNDSKTDIWSNPGLDFTDMHVEVEATKVGGDDNNDFGIICRYKDVNNFYFFVISSDGYYGLGKVADGTQQLIGDETMPPSEFINRGNATNIIMADCVGHKLSIHVNGIKLAEYEDTDFTLGDVGLIAGSFENPGTDIHFDNFIVLGP